VGSAAAPKPSRDERLAAAQAHLFEALMWLTRASAELRELAPRPPVEYYEVNRAWVVTDKARENVLALIRGGR
jgi:hypothetical protein